jgi:formylglycine-generating enzyme required for sulfatase activity
MQTAVPLINPRNHPLVYGRPPDWADAWGQDDYGAWVAFTIDEVTQKLRWIPPGEFLMGSPENEAGRYDIEGPQHEVTLSKGYWLFDTPCTQALWQAVMDDNPSRFKDPKRPVEQVSWQDVQKFLQQINERIAGLNLVLPTEAQWEYACRAGTTAATYAGDQEILGENNAPLLDAIAWYGGNSGHEFDLDEGEDSSSWSNKQYPHTRAGTRQVAQKRPNAWGLYDMLGNVWEWCLDARREYDITAVVDPTGPTNDELYRVVRGGSWYVDARRVRAAGRRANAPGFRYRYLGFRCARVQARARQVKQETAGGAQPVLRPRPGGAVP